MEAWVIKRKDGLYFWREDKDTYGFDSFYSGDYINPEFYQNEKRALDRIWRYGLKDCKPVKLRIEEVSDEKN